MLLASLAIESVSHISTGSQIPAICLSFFLSIPQLVVNLFHQMLLHLSIQSITTHEFYNLRAGAGTIQGNNIIITGLTDAGTNHRVVWKNVPTTISIQGGKTIRISVADNATNHHFAGQPVFGLVTLFMPCSDVPDTNMEVLPSCQK